VVDAFFYHHFLGFYNEGFAHWQTLHPEQHRGLDDSAYWTASHVTAHVVEFAPDVVLIIAGGALHRRAYDLIHRLHLPAVLLLTESPYIDATQTTIAHAGRVTACLTNDAYSVASLASATALPVRYLPHSFDPDIHRPDGAAIRSQAFFHGTLWPEREALLAPLRHIPGVVISGYTLDAIRPEDILDNAALAARYRGTHVALNHHRTCGDTGDIAPTAAYSLGPRAFEIAACGAFQLCDNTRPELYELFGDSVATYTDAADLQDKLAYYLAHPVVRQAMAARARQAVQGCTFAARADKILMPLLMEVI
jgi:spore maturation protein CgeB